MRDAPEEVNGRIELLENCLRSLHAYLLEVNITGPQHAMWQLELATALSMIEEALDDGD